MRARGCFFSNKNKDFLGVAFTTREPRRRKKMNDRVYVAPTPGPQKATPKLNTACRHIDCRSVTGSSYHPVPPRLKKNTATLTARTRRRAWADGWGQPLFFASQLLFSFEITMGGESAQFMYTQGTHLLDVGCGGIFALAKTSARRVVSSGCERPSRACSGVHARCANWLCNRNQAGSHIIFRSSVFTAWSAGFFAVRDFFSFSVSS